MPAENEIRRKWISDKLVQYVDIVFGVVVGQAIVRNADLILNPSTSLFAFSALVVVIVTTTLSWVGYHRSMYQYPYKADSLKASIRILTDFTVVVIYARLLFTVSALSIDPARINLSDFIFNYVLIFVSYLIDGLIRRWETQDPQAAKLNLSTYFAISYFVIFTGYSFSYTFNKYLYATNWMILALCLMTYLAYRITREKFFPGTIKRK